MTSLFPLDTWLSMLYAADNRGRLATQMEPFKSAVSSDTDLQAAAQQRLGELDVMIEARGETACAFSAKYRKYLQEALS